MEATLSGETAAALEMFDAMKARGFDTHVIAKARDWTVTYDGQLHGRTGGTFHPTGIKVTDIANIVRDNAHLMAAFTNILDHLNAVPSWAEEVPYRVVDQVRTILLNCLKR